MAALSIDQLLQVGDRCKVLFLLSYGWFGFRLDHDLLQPLLNLRWTLPFGHQAVVHGRPAFGLRWFLKRTSRGKNTQLAKEGNISMAHTICLLISQNK